MIHTGGTRVNVVLWALAVAPVVAVGPLALRPALDGESLWDLTVSQADPGAIPPFQEVDAIGVVAVGTTGACCVAPATCVNNQTLAQCNALGGTLFLKESCLTDPCGFLSRACCSPAGACVGDQTRAACESAGNTWHIEASCTGAGGLPTPKCNAYDVNNCAWDNGLPLNDGGASRSHTHSAGGGQLPRYDFNTADDFLLAGPDSTSCQVNSIRWYVSPRPTDTTGPVFVPANPPVNFIGVNVTVFENYLDPNTGLNSPAGFGLVPFDQNDLNPKVPYATEPGGVVYARTFCTGTAAAAVGICPGPVGLLGFTQLMGFCDPPPAHASEVGHIWQVDITVNPPLLLNKNKRYWLEVQGVFPFNDGLRESLQSWWAVSQNNSGFRGMTMRTNNAAYLVGGAVVWRPTAVAPSPQPGNQGAPAPCAAVPANTRLDYAFVINGAKDVPGIANDLCADAVEAFDGVTPFDSTGAASDGPNPASCATIEQDVWFSYTATCTGVLTVSTCGSDFDSIVAVYDGCMGAPALPGLGDGSLRAAAFTPRGRRNMAKNRSATTSDSIGTVHDADQFLTMPPTDQDGRISPPPQDGVGHPYAKTLGNIARAEARGSDLGCNDNNDACGAGSDDAYVQLVVAPDDTFLIRVGGVGAAQDAGLLSINCQQTCGSGFLACCSAHAPAVGCSNKHCCEAVCAMTGKEYCCNDLAIGWDQGCADAAALVPACRCPCSFICPPDAIAEGETCFDSINSGCGPTGFPSGADQFSGPLALTLAAPTHLLGTLTAFNEDWWLVDVPPTPTGIATLTLQADGNAPVGVEIIARREPLNTVAGENFCYVCVGGAGCCDWVDATFIELDSIATGSCQATDGDPCASLVICVPAPGQYALAVLPAQAGPNCELTEATPPSVTCGIDDAYCLGITATDGCAYGACCTCAGGCIDSLSNGPGVNEIECRAQHGTFAGENTTCASLPAGADCGPAAHGCVAAQEIACASTTMVDLTILDHAPDEPYPCSAEEADPNDSAWYKFTIPEGPGGLASVRIQTCNSVNPGRDSIVGLYGSCCPDSGLCASGRACTPGTTFCGGECCDLQHPLDVAGCSDDEWCGFTDSLSNICALGLVRGETYYIQVSNSSEPVNGLYSLELECACRGSCCDESLGQCADDVPGEDCSPPLQFDSERTCAQQWTPCGLGACCHADDTCTYTTLPNCQIPGDSHSLGTSCFNIICNPFDSCDYTTGSPDCLIEQWGFISQYSADIDYFVEIADDFEMKGSPGTLCVIGTIQYTVLHGNYDTTNGCNFDGGPSCAGDPSDYDGIIVTISTDEPAAGKGPTCLPTCAGGCTPGADGDYHDGPGCVHFLVFGPALAVGEPPPPGNYWQFADSCAYQITLHFQPPLRIEKNQKYWLAITHMWRAIGGYNVVWLYSGNFNGNNSQFYYNACSGMFEPLEDYSNDMLFDINGAKLTDPICTNGCRLYGDTAPLYCVVDVDDILYVLGAFIDPDPFTNFPGADIFPCAGSPGIIDVDDIIAELNAFTGTFACPHPCPPGACCIDVTDCFDNMTVTECGFFDNFDFRGDFTVCAELEGACCGIGGGCMLQTESACAAAGGTFVGPCSTCSQPTGACGFSDGSCTVGTLCDCIDLGGLYCGDGISCFSGSQSCCLQDGTCLYLGSCGCMAAGGFNLACGSCGLCCLPGGWCGPLERCECCRSGGVISPPYCGSCPP